jgi:hypothetical protein
LLDGIEKTTIKRTDERRKTKDPAPIVGDFGNGSGRKEEPVSVYFCEEPLPMIWQIRDMSCSYDDQWWT